MTEITETICRPKQSWMTAPGIVLKKETLDKCISDIFGFPEVYLNVKGRYMCFMYAKHLKRYILERMLKTGKLAKNDFTRHEGKSHRHKFKYTVPKIGHLSNCGHATIIHASRTCQNLMDTDKAYREKCNKVIDKINNNQIILP